MWAFITAKNSRAAWIQGAAWGLGLLLVAWQFFTFMDVVQEHTANAQRTSRSATWAGQPVGTTPQMTAALPPQARSAAHNNGFIAASLNAPLTAD